MLALKHFFSYKNIEGTYVYIYKGNVLFRTRKIRYNSTMKVFFYIRFGFCNNQNNQMKKKVIFSTKFTTYLIILGGRGSASF